MNEWHVRYGEQSLVRCYTTDRTVLCESELCFSAIYLTAETEEERS